MIKKDLGGGGGTLMLLSRICMYPCCNSFLGIIYVCLLLNAVHLAFVNCLTAARKLIDSIYSGFCDESERERDYFLVLIYFVTCLEKWIGFLCVRRLCFLKDKRYPIAYNQSKCLLFIIFPYYNQ